MPDADCVVNAGDSAREGGSEEAVRKAGIDGRVDDAREDGRESAAPCMLVANVAGEAGLLIRIDISCC